MDNRSVAQAFRDIADLLNIRGENFFRVRAYLAGAETLDNLSRPVSEYVAAGEDLTQFEGIGKDLAAKIEELVKTGSLEFLAKLGQETPLSLLDIMRLPGVGPKRTKQIYTELDVVDLRGLEKAGREGKLAQLPRFGATLESRILEQVRKRLSTGDEQRLPWREAHDIAGGILAHLKGLRGVQQLTIAGSYRRFRENVGDLDVLACCSKPLEMMERFTTYTRVAEVVSSGETRSTVRLKGGFQADLRVVPTESFGAALQYFTGSKAHNIVLRKRAVKLGLKLNEYGLFRDEKQIAGAKEEEIYKELGLSFVPPELRENMGEIESAEKNELPILVEHSDVRGEVRCRTSRSGGRGTLREMAVLAKKRGLKYMALCEPSRGVEPRTGLSEKQITAAWKEIPALNAELKGFTILRGVEVAIGPDGDLDLSEALLAECDLVIASAGEPFHKSEAKNTKRLLQAIEKNKIHILGHPSGRLLPQRESVPLDLKAVLLACAKHGTAVEINGRPEYTDLNGAQARLLIETGALAVVTADARSPSQLTYLDIAVGQARRGWLGKDQLLNTLSLAGFRKALRR